MSKQADFNKFLSNIEPSDSTVQYISSMQSALRDYLKSAEEYKDKYLDSFLSGSYAKHTSIRPSKYDKKRDVDIIVVLSYDLKADSSNVLAELKNILTNSSKYINATIQHHSVGVEMNDISIDVVPVIQDNDNELLYYIGDSKTGKWKLTDPLGHKNWSTEFNKSHNDKYKPIVKIFKWWRRQNCPSSIKYPKGITLEKIIADNLGDSSGSVEELMLETIENIISAYKDDFCSHSRKPRIEDPSDIVSNDLLEGYSVDDFNQFVYKLEEHLTLLNYKGTSNTIWREILGSVFPSDSGSEESNGRKICLSASHRQKLLWPFSRGNVAFIKVIVKDSNGNRIDYENDGDPLDKDCSLDFIAITGVKGNFIVKWQITNTGYEAKVSSCLRGGFEDSNVAKLIRHETTQFSGSHSVQCFIIKNMICVAKSDLFIVNIK